MALTKEERAVRVKCGSDAVFELARRHRWDHEVGMAVFEILGGMSRKLAYNKAAWWLKTIYPDEYEELRLANLAAAGRPDKV